MKKTQNNSIDLFNVSIATKSNSELEIILVETDDNEQLCENIANSLWSVFDMEFWTDKGFTHIEDYPFFDWSTLQTENNLSNEDINIIKTKIEDKIWMVNIPF